jgi:molybdenum cofactor cytidylyltransferase
MIFGVIDTSQAEGARLAHTTRLPGRVLSKGCVLQAEDVAALLRAGRTRVIAARLEPGDVPEDEAARRLAEALLSPGLALRLPGTGRANILAETPGLFRADKAYVDRLNMLHDSLTLGTLPDASPVAAGDMVATIKIIPFAAPASALAAATRLARGNRPLRLAPFRAMTAGLIMTTLPGLKPGVLDRTAGVMQARLARFGGTMLPPVTCAHDCAEIATALHGLLDRGAQMLLIAGASAVVDWQDVAPSGIVAAGGEILHVGMPVDPGNLLCLGRIATTPALVLPGCARSPALNGIDFVLARLFAGEPAGAAEIRRMGVGGLLKEFAARPVPRAGRQTEKDEWRTRKDSNFQPPDS